MLEALPAGDPSYSNQPEWSHTYLFCTARDRDTMFLASSALVIEYYTLPGMQLFDEHVVSSHMGAGQGTGRGAQRTLHDMPGFTEYQPGLPATSRFTGIDASQPPGLTMDLVDPVGYSVLLLDRPALDQLLLAKDKGIIALLPIQSELCILFPFPIPLTLLPAFALLDLKFEANLHIRIPEGTKMRAVTGKLPCAELLLRVHMTPRPPPLLGAIALDTLPVYEPSHAELASKYYDDTPVARDPSVSAESAAEPALRPKMVDDEPVRESRAPRSGSLNDNDSDKPSTPGAAQADSSNANGERSATPDSVKYYSPGDAEDMYHIERYYQPQPQPKAKARRTPEQKQKTPEAARREPEKPRSPARSGQKPAAADYDDDPDTPRPDPYRRPEWPPRRSFAGVRNARLFTALALYCTNARSIPRRNASIIYVQYMCKCMRCA